MPDFAKALRRLRPAQTSQPSLFQPAHAALSLGGQMQWLKGGGGGNVRLFGKPAPPDAGPFECLPEGEEEKTPFGRHYAVRQVYTHDYDHGRVRLSRFSCSDLKQLMTLMRQQGSVPERGRILFLDTETTGMQGGAGMCPFMIGLGYFEDDDFHMLQYFIRDFDEEHSMLHALSLLVERFALVVTYNGASFDIPLLESRFTLTRMDNPFAGMPHLDLLPGARRLWRNGHGSCRLTALESRIVAFERGPDVPGAMIPGVYFDFLQGRSSPVLRGVFKHNVHDVMTLAALTVCACDRVTSEPAALDDPLDLFSLAAILDNTPQWKRAIRLYELALAGGLPAPARIRCQESLAVLYRRAGEHDRALALAAELIRQPGFSLTAYEGAAIYYERVVADHARALEIIEHGLARLDPPSGPDLHATSAQIKKWKTALAARRERLRQKVIRF